jgi:single-stranded DNA-binding protein
VVALAAQPAESVAHGKQVLEVFANTTGKDQMPVLLRCAAGSKTAEVLQTKPPGQTLIIAGDLLLEEGQPLIFVRTLCDAPADAYVNEITVTGRLAKEARVAESNKSASRSLAVNRAVKGEEVTDWFNVRGYGYVMDRLVSLPVGTLAMVAGLLEQRTNRDGKPYAEIKARTIRVYERGRGSRGSSNPAAGTKAVGYDHEDFVNAADDMPFDWNAA